MFQVIKIVELAGKYLCLALFFDKVADCNFNKMRLRHMYSSTSFTKFLRTPILQNLLKTASWFGPWEPCKNCLRVNYWFPWWKYWEDSDYSVRSGDTEKISCLHMQIQIRINLILMKTKKTLICVRENNLVLRQFTSSKNITVFIKNDVHIMKLF